MSKTFDLKKPTAQLLGRWQPWHDGHTALFKKALAEVGQVCIMIRDVSGISGDVGAGRTVVQDDNPFDMEEVNQSIITALAIAGYIENEEDKYVGYINAIQPVVDKLLSEKKVNKTTKWEYVQDYFLNLCIGISISLFGLAAYVAWFK